MASQWVDGKNKKEASHWQRSRLAVALAISSGGVKGADTLEETGKFSHAHKDLRSQVKKGTYTAKWTKGASDFSLA